MKISRTEIFLEKPIYWTRNKPNNIDENIYRKLEFRLFNWSIETNGFKDLYHQKVLPKS